MQVMIILSLLFSFSIGYATFIENDFGRSSAKSLIFSAWWFEAILGLLVFNLVNNLIKFRLFRLEKIAALTFHLSFIIILLGAAITRYVSYEGMMHIREGDASNLFISDDTFIQVHINDRLHQYSYDKKLFLSGISNNNFDINVNFKDNDIFIESISFLPNVKDSLFVGLDDGKTILHIVVPGDDGMQDEFIDNGQQKMINGEYFTFNNAKVDAINFFSKDGVIKCRAPYSVSTMSMLTRELNEYDALKLFSLNKKTLHTANELNFVLKDVLNNAKLIPVSASNVMVDGKEDALVLNVKANGESKEVILYGGKGYAGSEEVFAIKNLNFKLSYGSKYYTTPFRVKLRDFQLDRYAGSMSPSSYAAEVSILDGETVSEHRIFMNNVLNYRGFRLFQSSYDKDEKGTILSVNHDWWGTLITYIGYFLLGLGFILVFLTKKTRYRALSDKLKKLSAIIILPFIINISAFAEDSLLDMKKQEFNANHISRFDALVVQDNGGRLKPVHTLTSEYLRKIYGKDNFEDKSATEVILGMMSDPVIWSKEPIIKVSHQKLRLLLSSTDEHSKYIRVSFNDFFDSNGHYLLAKDVQFSYEKLPKDRNQYDKDLIKVDERVNICFAVYGGGIFRFFPLPNDSNNTWVTFMQSTDFRDNDSLFVANIIPMYFKGVKEAMETNNWTTADTIISYIQKFQLRYGAEVLPVQTKIDLEITYNKLNIFSRLFMYYSLVGVLLLILIIISLFNQNKWLMLMILFFKWLIILGFIAHIAGLALRWYISDHAPWSNGYESMIYIAWATILSGIIFSRRSLLALAATAIVSGLLLMVAHLNWLDPEITNLVPVLKSYWLMIHVAIITASYGFLSLGAILGLIALWLIIFTNTKNKDKLKNTLTELTVINEKTLEIGLFMLAIGTFLGGVWANESWGRYWGWDPKETWALVSVLIYSFVLHMRFIPSLRNEYVFNVISMFAIWTIIMTYFGVNYYLSGLHSYAAGDPMPIPDFVYYLIGLMFVTTFIAKFKFKKNYSK
jgi:cytochrome c-type biogenesis protein CcsB